MKKHISRVVWGSLLATTCLALASPDAKAGGISGFNPVAGGSTISTSPDGKTTVIHQPQDKAINEFQELSVGAGTTLRFDQRSASSIALNRVRGGSMSPIDGVLQANGNVWIVNPNGVIFGRGAQVDVGGLLVTTGDIRNQDFLNGTYSFSGATGASIVNLGTIRAASGGSVVLAGARVDNQGLIVAELGSVTLAAGKAFTLDLNGDKLLRFQVTAAVDAAPADGGAALVTNSGKISAPGGTVLLTARAAKGVIDNVINTSGIIEATRAQQVNGEIVLDGGDTGGVQVDGTLDASTISIAVGSIVAGGFLTFSGGAVTITAGDVIDFDGIPISPSGLTTGAGTGAINLGLGGGGGTITVASGGGGGSTITLVNSGGTGSGTVSSAGSSSATPGGTTPGGATLNRTLLNAVAAGGLSVGSGASLVAAGGVTGAAGKPALGAVGDAPPLFTVQAADGTTDRAPRSGSSDPPRQ